VTDPASLIERMLSVQAELVLEVQGLRRLVERLATHAPPAPQTRVLEALAAVYGHGVSFTSSDVADALTLRVDTRQALRQALHVALAGKAPTAERIGSLLRRIVAAGPAAGWMLCTPATDGGARVWMLEQVG
jgi:hypothetical protein